MRLQLDAFLIKRYFSKLDPNMQKNLLELLKTRCGFVERMMDLNFERQNCKFDRVLSFMRHLESISMRRIGEFDNTFDSLKVNRFICKNWGNSLTFKSDDLSEMIRQAYIAEVAALRTMHHQTEVYNSARMSDGRPSSLDKHKVPIKRQRMGTMVDGVPSLGHHQSVMIDSVLGDLCDEAS